MEQIDPTYMISKLRETMPPVEFTAFQDEMTRIRNMDEIATAWRMEADLREFAPTKPTYCLFEYPLHIYDEHGILSGLHADGEKGTMKEAQTVAAEKKKKQKVIEFDDAFAKIVVDKEDKCATRSELLAHLKVNDRTLRSYSNDPDILEFYIWDPGTGGAGVWRRREVVSDDFYSDTTGEED